MEEIKHITHEHPLILSKYNHSPVNAPCGCCSEPILINTSFYHCTLQSITTHDSTCKTFFLHKTCANLPLAIQHRGGPNHVLALNSAPYEYCFLCFKSVGFWKYVCTGDNLYTVCLKCAFLQQRQLNHPSHNHTLTLLPLKALHVCTACGQEEKYRRYGVSCYLCPEKINSFYWLYYCAGCRYFAHIHCALSAAESGKYDDLEDFEGSNSVHLPISDNEPDLLYQLIQQFAKEFNTSTAEESRKADKISQCRNELPREIQHALHPGKELVRLTRFYETPLPSKIKHDSHKHTLHLQSTKHQRRKCRGCKNDVVGIYFGCTTSTCDYYIHVMCARKARTTKHKWDEHQLSLMYRPVKGHPQDFDCELCSEDIDPNYWFYHCRICDTSFHTPCVDQNYSTNIKYGGIVKDESLHEHSLQIIGTKQEFKCGKCGRAQFFRTNFGTDEKQLNFLMKPFLKCVSCKFFVCMECSVDTWFGSFL
ncbi:hypothetical protein POM88_000848 [Heracleum sosnowskyi]|uniref:DC1 domain-containing protein n=1 Tax=Heracleum sosnowskyi TaxID=360622 RepID=A0AAD8JCC4_9APIA|nr:hypothetical protein POM88_000848 [Heracleum sosnowskyi]